MTSRLTNFSEPRRSVIATLLPLRYSVKVILKPQATGRIDKTVRDSSGYIYDQRLTSGGLWSRYPGGMTQMLRLKCLLRSDGYHRTHQDGTDTLLLRSVDVNGARCANAANNKTT